MSFLPDLSLGHARLAKLRLSKLARPRVNTHPLAFSLARTVLLLSEKLERVAIGAFQLFSLVLCRSKSADLLYRRKYVTRNRINKTTHQTTHPTSWRDACHVTKCTRLPPRFYTQCDKKLGGGVWERGYTRPLLSAGSVWSCDHKTTPEYWVSMVM